MKKLPLERSRSWLTGAAAGLATFSGGEHVRAAPRADVSESPMRRAATLERYSGGYENVLGTSLDVILEAARPADAFECETRILGEIERLRRLLSPYDPASEIRRAMAGGAVESEELATLLAHYAEWTSRTEGLIDLNLGGVTELWREAARTGRLPDAATLAAAAQHARAYNVDALGKGFIIDRAVAVARRCAPGGLLNLGGDLRAWGDHAWEIGIADPANPADNAPPLARFTLREAAVATSGSYARGFVVGGQRYSHLIDPRTRWPVAPGGSATVVADDCVTANALATAAAVSGFANGERLARAWGAAGYFFASAAGASSGGGVLAGAASPTSPAAPAAKEKPADAPTAAEASWPAGFQVSFEVVLKKHDPAKPVYRPYVALWIQNTRGQVVRTISLWGTEERWQRRLTAWWNQPGLGGQEPAPTTRATRPAGTYTVTWNGIDDFGRRLPQGDYTLCLEVCREAGGHTLERVKLSCGPEPVTAAFRETTESGAAEITYGPSKPSPQ